MKILTYNFLHKITHRPPEELYLLQKPSEDIELHDKKMIIDARNFGLIQMHKKKKEIKQLYQKYATDNEKLIVLELFGLLYYFEVRDEAQLKQELKLCEDMLASDICKRNPKIREEIMSEAKRLRLAVETDIVKYAFCYLVNLYKNEYPNISNTERIVRTSTLMNYLGLFKETPFMTEEEAQDYLDRNPQLTTKTARKLIEQNTSLYWRNCK